MINGMNGSSLSIDIKYTTNIYIPKYTFKDSLISLNYLFGSGFPPHCFNYCSIIVYFDIWCVKNASGLNNTLSISYFLNSYFSKNCFE